MKVKFKKFVPWAKIPVKANPTDAAFDCFCVDYREEENYIEYDLGFALEIPPTHYAVIYPRSSISNYDLILCNSVGVIDSGYRGKITCRFRKTGENIYNEGDKVCQITFHETPQVEFEEADSLDENNDRGGGYGSTGK